MVYSRVLHWMLGDGGVWDYRMVSSQEAQMTTVTTARNVPWGVGVVITVNRKPYIIVERPDDTTLTIRKITWAKYIWCSFKEAVTKMWRRIFRK